MLPVLYRFPLDATATSIHNLVLGEEHEMQARDRRVIAPKQGCFYAKSLHVVNPATNQEYKRGQHYVLNGISLTGCVRFGREVASLIVIIDPSVPSYVKINYQAVGDEYQEPVDVTRVLMQQTQLDTRPVFWENIFDRKTEFDPVKHLHDIGDPYNFNETVYLVDRMRQAVELSDMVTHDPFYLTVDTLKKGFDEVLNNFEAQLQAHFTDTKNPHRLTPEQINAYTYEQFDQLLNTYYQNRLAQVVLLENKWNAHLRANNPHQDSAAKIGSLTAAQMEAEIQQAMSGRVVGDNGNWEYVDSVWTYGTSYRNETTAACLYAISSMGTGDRGTAAKAYVDESLITDAFNYQLRDPKTILTVVEVPAGSTLRIDSNANGYQCRLLVYRFRPSVTGDVTPGAPPGLDWTTLSPLYVQAGPDGAYGFSDGGGYDGFPGTGGQFGALSGTNSTNQARISGAISNWILSYNGGNNAILHSDPYVAGNLEVYDGNGSLVSRSARVANNQLNPPIDFSRYVGSTLYVRLAN